MTDRTRTPVDAEDWLAVRCSTELQHRLARPRETGEALVVLVAEWSDLASEVTSDFERGLTDRGLPEDLLQHAGAATLIDLSGEIGRLADSACERATTDG